jgi:hypothetical protein
MTRRLYPQLSIYVNCAQIMERDWSRCIPITCLDPMNVDPMDETTHWKNSWASWVVPDNYINEMALYYDLKLPWPRWSYTAHWSRVAIVLP